MKNELEELVDCLSDVLCSDFDGKEESYREIASHLIEDCGYGKAWRAFQKCAQEVYDKAAIDYIRRKGDKSEYSIGWRAGIYQIINLAISLGAKNVYEV